MPEPYKSMARNALFDRYQYLRHMYTCLFEASQTGQTCFDPILFHNAFDDESFNANQTEHSFIVGDALKVSPVLAPGISSFKSYFPKGRWVSMKNYADVVDSNENGKGAYKVLQAPNDTVNVHLKPGSLVFIQNNKD